MPSSQSMPIPCSRRVREFLHRHRLLLLLLAVDVATKVAAFELLPHARAIAVLPGLTLYLAVNDWGVMGGVHGMGVVTGNPAYTMFLALGLFLFAIVVVRLGASTLGLGWRMLAGTMVFFAVALAAPAAAIPFAGLELPAEAIVMTIRMAALAVSVAFYVASTATMPRTAFAFLAAGALGNAVSHTYPPFEVVDFLMVPIQRLLALLGGRAGEVSETTVGVVNMADLYLFSFPLLLAAWPASALLMRARGLART